MTRADEAGAARWRGELGKVGRGQERSVQEGPGAGVWMAVQGKDEGNGLGVGGMGLGGGVRHEGVGGAVRRTWRRSQSRR